MRECHRNYAHGTMKLVTYEIEVEYKGELLSCEKTVYGCSHCDFQLHLDWMKDKLQLDIENAYRVKKGLS